MMVISKFIVKFYIHNIYFFNMHHWKLEYHCGLNFLKNYTQKNCLLGHYWEKKHSHSTKRTQSLLFGHASARMLVHVLRAPRLLLLGPCLLSLCLLACCACPRASRPASAVVAGSGMLLLRLPVCSAWAH
jgi:hypothetical protein